MAVTWTLTGEAGKALDATPRTLEAMSANNARLERRCLGMDRMVYTVPLRALDGSGIIVPEHRQPVTLSRNGVRYFKGHCTKNVPVYQGGEWYRSIEVSGLWWWLKQIQMTSDQLDQGGNIKERPVLVCDTGNLSSMFAAVINRGIALGGPWALGTIATTASIVRVTLPNASVADALTELMRWVADGMLWVDYAPATPTINLTRRLAGLAVGSAAAKTLTVGTDRIETINLLPRIDLTVSQVVLPYVTRNAQGRGLYQVQSAGAAVTGQRQMIPVAGPELDTTLPKDQFDSSTVKSATISPSGILNTALFTTYDSRLKASGGASFAVGPKSWSLQGGGTYTLPAVSTVVEKRDGGALPAGRTRFLTQGEPADWWEGDAIGWEQARASATIWVEVKSPVPTPNGYSPSPPSWVESMGMSQATFTVLSSGLMQRIDVYYTTISVMFPAVDTLWNAVTTLYRKEDYSYLNPPAGMATYLVAAQNWEPYEGSVTVIEDDLPATVPIGQLLSIAGGPPDLAGVKALIQGVNMTLATGVMELQCGAAERLSFPQLVARFRRTGADNIDQVKDKPLTPA